MPKLTPAKPRDVIQKLQRFGFKGPFGGGRHVFMRHPETHLKIPVPMHQGRDLPIGTLRAIVRQVGVSVEEWLEL